MIASLLYFMYIKVEAAIKYLEYNNYDCVLLSKYIESLTNTDEQISVGLNWKLFWPKINKQKKTLTKVDFL